MSEIRVALVDDQQLVRAGFAMVIESQPDMTVVAEAADGAEAIRRLALVAADIVLMDVRMPNMDGLAATERIVQAAQTWPRPPGEGEFGPDEMGRARPRVIMLTTFDLEEYLLAAIRAGASGFLLKDAPPEDMLAAIRTVHAGDAVIAPSSTRQLLEHVATALPNRTPTPALFDDLTEREREVLVLIARGHSNTEIGAELFIAEATVKTHVGRVLAKIGARDRVQAVVAAYENGLIHPGQ